MPSSAEVSRLITQVRAGDANAVAQLMPLVYDELRRLAALYLRRERGGHTLQATALVHEAYLKLVDQPPAEWQDRAHFLGIAARVMRRVLIDYARGHQAEKRGGEQVRLSFDECQSSIEGATAISDGHLADLLTLDDAMDRLAAVDPKIARLVELRFYGGLSIEETAEVLGVSPATVKREWTLARAWLRREMGGTTDPSP
jgi:RNA polymerase sigma factor (TIGR02999 family)